MLICQALVLAYSAPLRMGRTSTPMMSLDMLPPPPPVMIEAAPPLAQLSSYLELSVALSPDFGAPDHCVAFFTSKSCAACRRLEPRVRRLASRYPEVRFLHIIASRAPDSACTAYDVSGVPSFLCFDRGTVIDRFEEVTFAGGFAKVIDRVELLASEAATRREAAEPEGCAIEAVNPDGGWAVDSGRVALAALAAVHPLARYPALVAAVALGPAMVGAGAAAAAAEEEEMRMAMEPEGDAKGSPVDWLPIVSQCRSMVQALAGDGSGALLTQERFSRRCPLVSQCRSLAESLMGDNAAARRTQLEQLKMLRGLVSYEQRVATRPHARQLSQVGEGCPE